MPDTMASDIPGGRLLVVDDDDNNRDMLSRRLMRRGYAVDVAVNGTEAIDAVHKASRAAGGGEYQLVLLDIEMPGLSGFDVLSRVRQTHPGTRLPVIIATARHDREDIVQALKLGANDYVTKPIDFPVVLARVEAQLKHKQAVDRIVALEADVRRQNAALEKANARMRHSLEMAAKVQRSLLPDKSPLQIGGLRFAWRFNPCDELGGDIFNAFALADGNVAIYLLDVSGHGVPAALLSVTLSRLLTPVNAPSLVETLDADGKLVARAPSDVVAELNRRFPLGERGGQYFTMFYGVFDCRYGRLTYVQAGHPPGLSTAADRDARPLDGDGFAVGWFDDARFDEQTIPLTPGEGIVLYSDGIPETMDDAATHFGTKRLADALDRRRGEPLDAQLDELMRDIDAFRGGAEVLDDVTVLAVQCAC